MRRFNKVTRTVALAGLFAVLGGCSEYLDRRDSIALSGGDAVATNVVTHTVDPWPPASANRNLAFNGQKMETAVERYRTNRVIPPRGIGTSGSYTDNGGGGGQNNAGPVGTPVAAPAAAVK
jgi:hypothetical protein